MPTLAKCTFNLKELGCISRQWASGFLLAYRSFFSPGGPHNRRW
jgi:hypothetical protein